MYELVEYLLHRFLHARRVQYHENHHRNHRVAYLYSRRAKLTGGLHCAGSLLFLVVWSSMRLDLCLKLVGLYVGYGVLLYNTTHLYSHSSSSTYHRLHHTNPRYNFGISSPVWDYLFGTLHRRYTVSNRWYLLLPGPLSFLALSTTAGKPTSCGLCEENQKKNCS